MTSQTAQRRLTAADFTTTYTINMTAIGEHGNHYVAYGHVEPREFIYELRRYNGVQSLGLDDDELFQMVIDQDFGGVRQEWAALTADSPDDEWLITWADVTEETPAAFPITRLSFDA